MMVPTAAAFFASKEPCPGCGRAAPHRADRAQAEGVDSFRMGCCGFILRGQDDIVAGLRRSPLAE